jgi:hypothetical protein
MADLCISRVLTAKAQAAAVVQFMWGPVTDSVELVK